MKRIISAYLGIFLILFTACDSFIGLNPISTVTTEAVFKTDKDFQDAVIGCYAALRDQYQNFWQFGDLRGDDSEAQMFKGNTVDYINDFTVDNTAGVLNTTWLNYYEMIFRTNAVIQNIESIDESVVPNKNRHIGEARFLRALAYFDLIRIFGPVPLITENITVEESYTIPRTDVETVYDEIIADLNTAAQLLPTQYNGTDVGRATAGAATALLGRVYLTRGDFTNAEATLLEVTRMGYALLDDYNDLFNYDLDEHHSEYIFDVEYQDGGLGMGSSFTHNFAPRVPAILNLYGISGQGGDNQNPTDALFSVFTDDDLRKDITVARGAVDDQGVFIPLPPNQVRAFTKKYITPTNVNDGKANWKVIRYADVLLMLAEALNENGKTEEALGYLNQVRERAGVSRYEGLTADETREKIYLERRLELSFEGHRWFDLVRTGRAYEVMQSTGMKEYMTVFPIPLVQLQVVNNPQILSQNPGYE